MINKDKYNNYELWEQVQANGLKAYQQEPKSSCSVRGRKDVDAFRKFIKIKHNERVLDIGCGPIGTPYYLKSARFAVGIDPLPGTDSPGMLFIQGFGESMPFADSSFDLIILATSLDHVLSPIDVLKESKRCMRKKGRIVIWIWVDQTVPPPEELKGLNRLIDNINNLINIYFPIKKKNKDEKLTWLELNASLKTPTGALDPYHLRYDNVQDITKYCNELGLFETRREQYELFNLFLEFRLNW